MPDGSSQQQAYGIFNVNDTRIRETYSLTEMGLANHEAPYDGKERSDASVDFDTRRMAVVMGGSSLSREKATSADFVLELSNTLSATNPHRAEIVKFIRDNGIPQLGYGIRPMQEWLARKGNYHSVALSYQGISDQIGFSHDLSNEVCFRKGELEGTKPLPETGCVLLKQDADAPWQLFQMVNGMYERLDIDVIPGLSDVLHGKTFADIESGVDASFALADFSRDDFTSLASLPKSDWNDKLFIKIQEIKCNNWDYREILFTWQEIKHLEALLKKHGLETQSAKLVVNKGGEPFQDKIRELFKKTGYVLTQQGNGPWQLFYMLDEKPVPVDIRVIPRLAETLQGKVFADLTKNNNELQEEIKQLFQVAAACLPPMQEHQIYQCDLYIKPTLPESESLLNYANAYVYVGSENSSERKIYYITSNGASEEITISNWASFNNVLEGIKQSHPDTTRLFLTEVEIQKLIAENGGDTHQDGSVRHRVCKRYNFYVQRDINNTVLDARQVDISFQSTFRVRYDEGVKAVAVVAEDHVVSEGFFLMDRNRLANSTDFLSEERAGLQVRKMEHPDRFSTVLTDLAPEASYYALRDAMRKFPVTPDDDTSKQKALLRSFLKHDVFGLEKQDTELCDERQNSYHSTGIQLLTLPEISSFDFSKLDSSAYIFAMGTDVPKVIYYEKAQDSAECIWSGNKVSKLSKRLKLNLNETTIQNCTQEQLKEIIRQTGHFALPPTCHLELQGCKVLQEKSGGFFSSNTILEKMLQQGGKHIGSIALVDCDVALTEKNKVMIKEYCPRARRIILLNKTPGGQDQVYAELDGKEVTAAQVFIDVVQKKDYWLADALLPNLDLSAYLQDRSLDQRQLINALADFAKSGKDRCVRVLSLAMESAVDMNFARKLISEIKFFHLTAYHAMLKTNPAYCISFSEDLTKLTSEEFTQWLAKLSSYSNVFEMDFRDVVISIDQYRQLAKTITVLKQQGIEVCKPDPSNIQFTIGEPVKPASLKVRSYDDLTSLSEKASDASETKYSSSSTVVGLSILVNSRSGSPLWGGSVGRPATATDEAEDLISEPSSSEHRLK